MNNINNMNSKNEMKAYLEYVAFLKNKANYQFGIDEAIRRSGLSSDVFFGSLVNYINKNVVKGRYETIFDQIISIITFIGVLIFDAYVFYVNFNDRQSKIKKREDLKVKSKNILLNTIAEIVDYQFICKESKDINRQTNEFLNNLDYREYIRGEERNIEVGGSNE